HRIDVQVDTEFHVAGVVAGKTDVEDVEHIRGKVAEADFLVGAAGRLSQVEGELDAVVERQVGVGNGDRQNADVAAGRQVAGNLDVAEREKVIAGGGGLDEKALAVHAEDRMELDVHVEIDVAPEEQRAAKGLQVEAGHAVQGLVHGHVEDQAVAALRERDVSWRRIEVVERLAQRVGIGNVPAADIGQDLRVQQPGQDRRQLRRPAFALFGLRL